MFFFFCFFLSLNSSFIHFSEITISLHLLFFLLLFFFLLHSTASSSHLLFFFFFILFYLSSFSYLLIASPIPSHRPPSSTFLQPPSPHISSSSLSLNSFFHVTSPSTPLSTFNLLIHSSILCFRTFYPATSGFFLALSSLFLFFPFLIFFLPS